MTPLQVEIVLDDYTKWITDLREKTHRSGPQVPADDKQLLVQLLSVATSAGACVQTQREEKVERPYLRFGPNRRGPGVGDPKFQTVQVLYETVQIIASIGGGAALVKILKDPVVQWLRNRGSRSVKVVTGSTTIEVRGNADIDRALAAVERLEAKGELVKAARPPKKAVHQRKPAVNVVRKREKKAVKTK